MALWRRKDRGLAARASSRLALAATLALAAAPIAAADSAPDGLAIADFDFVDTSGEVESAASDHSARLKAFDSALREGFAAKGVKLVALACPEDHCSAADPGFEPLASRARQANARYLILGGVHKMSTLVGWVKLVVVDLGRENAVCDRLLTYRGDTLEAWQRAAKFAVRDVERHCLK
jgi:hypothetical protein